MDPTVKNLVSSKGNSKEMPALETETEEEKERIMTLHRNTIQWCGKQIQQDWIDMQVMGAGSMDDMIDNRLSNIDWNNGWFACSKHISRMCMQLGDYVLPEDGQEPDNTEDCYYGTNYVTMAENAIKRMKAKIEMLEFEVRKGKSEDISPSIFSR